MTPKQAFMEFSNYILSPKDTGFRTEAEMFDFAIRHVTGHVRRLAALHLDQQLAQSDEELEGMWIGSNARVAPAREHARLYSTMAFQRLHDPAVPDGRAVPEVEPGP